jgi:hypothetical protein
MSEQPKFAQKRPSIHLNIVPQFMHLPRHPRNLWGFTKLPRLESKEREANTDEQRFEHFDRPTNCANGDLEHKVASLVHLLQPHRAEKPRTDEKMSGVLSLGPRDS